MAPIPTGAPAPAPEPEPRSNGGRNGLLTGLQRKPRNSNNGGVAPGRELAIEIDVPDVPSEIGTPSKPKPPAEGAPPNTPATLPPTPSPAKVVAEPPRQVHADGNNDDCSSLSSAGLVSKEPSLDPPGFCFRPEAAATAGSNMMAPPAATNGRAAAPSASVVQNLFQFVDTACAVPPPPPPSRALRSGVALADDRVLVGAVGAAAAAAAGPNGHSISDKPEEPESGRKTSAIVSYGSPMERCLLPCAPTHAGGPPGRVGLEPEAALAPRTASPAASSEEENDPAMLVETFEMILEEPAAAARKRGKFRLFRRGRAARRSAGLNVVAAEAPAVEGEVIPELAVDDDEDLEDDTDDDEPPAPPLPSVTKDVIVEEVCEAAEAEEKKEDVDDMPYPVSVAPPPASAPVPEGKRSPRHKQLFAALLSSRRARVKVPSESDSESLVRVPGLETPDKFLSSDELIGEDCAYHEKLPLQDIVEEDDFSDEESEAEAELNDDRNAVTGVDASNKQFSAVSAAVSSCVSPSFGSENMESPKGSDSKKGRPRIVIKHPRGWLPVLTCQNEPVTKAILAEQCEVSTSTCQPSQTGSAAYQESKKKAVWKAATCSSSGRIYWYHRHTRETTWVKPPQDEIIQRQSRSDRSQEVSDSKLRDSPSEAKDVAEEESQMDPIEEEGTLVAIKREIAEILKSMSPPDGPSIDRLMAQYDGQEEQLLLQLMDIAESKPFDEPLEKDTTPNTKSQQKPPRAPPVTGLTTSVSHISGPRFKRVPTQLTHISGQSHITESTVQIKNTFNPYRKKRNDFETGSISSARQQMFQQKSSEKSVDGSSSMSAIAVDKVPSKVPVPRTRELVVEEFNSSGFKAETFDVKGRHVTSRMPFRYNRPNRPARPATTHGSPVNYLGEAGVGNTHGEDGQSLPGDSISALSDAEYAWDRSRRARVSAVGKAPAVASPVPEPRPQTTTEWAQAELDRFISKAEWGTLANYITRLGAEPEPQPPTEVVARVASVDISESSPRRRFGARSQLQHPAASDAKLGAVVRSGSRDSASHGRYMSDEYSLSAGSISSLESGSFRAAAARSRPRAGAAGDLPRARSAPVANARRL